MRLVYKLLTTCVFLFGHAAICEQFIDFEEEMMSEFVEKTKKIDIPGFPDAFNPSIVAFRDSWLMSFRTGDFIRNAMTGESGDAVDDSESFLMSFRFRDPTNPACEIDETSQKAGINCKNQIGLVLLNQHFEPISWPQILKISYEEPMIAQRQQDPRLLYVGNRLYMVYSNMLNGNAQPEIRRMFVVELTFDGANFIAGEPVYLDQFEGKDDQKWTKNWVPFDYNDRLYLAHSITPHRIFEFNGTHACGLVGNTLSKVVWDYGVLRGGTPAIYDEGRYLSFFHSSKEMKSAHTDGKKLQHYFMGAYTFNPEPPFALTAISKVPIIGKNFMHGPVHRTWKPLRVVFPGGIIVGKQKVWVAYGRQDHEVWIATMDKKRLLDSLVPVD